MIEIKIFINSMDLAGNPNVVLKTVQYLKVYGSNFVFSNTFECCAEFEQSGHQYFRVQLS